MSAGRGGYGKDRRCEVGDLGGVDTGLPRAGLEAREENRVEVLTLLIEYSELGGDGGIGSCSHSGAASADKASLSANESMVSHGRSVGGEGPLGCLAD